MTALAVALSPVARSQSYSSYSRHWSVGTTIYFPSCRSTHTHYRLKWTAWITLGTFASDINMWWLLAVVISGFMLYHTLPVKPPPSHFCEEKKDVSIIGFDFPD